MRKIIAGFATSIDGFVEGPNGAIDWIVSDKTHFQKLADSWKAIDAMFHGRKTFEAGQKMAKGNSKKVWDPFAHMKHYVFSRTLKSVPDGFILINDDVEKQVMRIKSQPGKNIAVFGGPGLLSSLMNIGLVDEISLAICPVVLGNGKRFFTDLNSRTDFTLKEVHSYPSGLVTIDYSKK